MDTIAAVTTAKGIAAISSIELLGLQAHEVIGNIFEPNSGGKLPELITGKVCTGKIVSHNKTIDHVVLGVLDTNDYEISCHGNPLIVEQVMKLLAENGVRLVSLEELLLAKQHSNTSANSIQTESNIAKLKAATIKGVELIANQPKYGLGKLAAEWFDGIDSIDLKEQAAQILKLSYTARFLFTPVKAVIVGAPNAGKSTLLNALAGKQKAIVTDIAGTTRDWVSTTLKVGDLLIEFIDTAGLDAAIINNSQTDADSQSTAHKLISRADIVLLVVDISNENKAAVLNVPSEIKTIVVYNKSDLGGNKCPDIKADAAVSISAKDNRNIDGLLNVIIQTLAVDVVKINDSVCFTARQIGLLQKIISAKDTESAKTSISQLLTGTLSV